MLRTMAVVGRQQWRGVVTVYSLATVEAADHSLLYVTELLHRVQNEHTKTISFVSMMETRSANPEAKTALNQVIKHLHASANAHDILRPPVPGVLVDFTSNLVRLCRAISSASLEQSGITLDLTVSGSVLLDSGRCWRASLILSELITNAQRHAFGPRGGRISIVVTDACGSVVCRVSDDGRPNAAPRKGLGTQLIDALTADLNGDVKRTYDKAGTRVTLKFPKKHASGGPYLDSLGR